MKAVYLEWEDSSSYTGNLWSRRERIIESTVSHCKTIGFILNETKESITVITSADGEKEGCVSGDMTIPKSAIKKRRVVTWKK